MTQVKDILDLLETFAPYELAESWDNCGLLVGDRQTKVSKVLCALDITHTVIEEAEAIGAQLIVAHHPVIFTQTNTVTTDTVTGSMIISMIQKGISGICMHTNADCAQGGVNDLLAQKLGLHEIENLGAGDTGTLGRVGNLPKAMALENFAAYVKDRLKAGGVRYTNGGKTVQRVAVLGGAGGKLMEYALQKGADTYVIGDCSYDIMQKAHDLGLNLIDAGHFPTETAIAEGFAAQISQAFPQIEAVVSQKHKDCIEFV